MSGTESMLSKYLLNESLFPMLGYSGTERMPGEEPGLFTLYQEAWQTYISDGRDVDRIEQSLFPGASEARFKTEFQLHCWPGV